MHIYLAKSSRFESTGFASVMIDEVGCSRRHQCPQRAEDDEILICGDLNAHTNISTDYIDDDLNGSDGELANILPNDDGGKRSQQVKKLREKHELTRYSDDKRPNSSRGKQLNDLSKPSGLLIANGWLGSDICVQKFARYEMSPNEIYGGVVDYVLTTPALFDSIDSFEIGNEIPV